MTLKKNRITKKLCSATDFDGDSELGKNDLEQVLNYLSVQETSILSGEEKETIVDKVRGQGSILARDDCDDTSPIWKSSHLSRVAYFRLGWWCFVSHLTFCTLIFDSAVQCFLFKCAGAPPRAITLRCIFMPTQCFVYANLEATFSSTWRPNASLTLSDVIADK